MFLFSNAFAALLSGLTLSAGPLELPYFRICKEAATGTATPAQAHAVKQIQSIVHEADCTKSARILWELQELDLSRTDLETTEVLEGMPKLLTLFIEKNPLETIDVKNLPLLRTIFASATPAKSLKLHNLPRLVEVRAGLGQITEVEMDTLPFVKVFDVSFNQLDNMKFVEKIPATEHLLISNNKISTFDASNMTQLRIVEAHDNQITSIDAIRHNGVLLDAYFNNNKISDLTPLKPLRLLYKIEFENNLIEDVSPLTKLKLDNNLSLKLLGNPIGRNELQCPTLHNFLELRIFCLKRQQGLN